jgi:hypothetical protein
MMGIVGTTTAMVEVVEGTLLTIVGMGFKGLSISF